MNLGRDQVTVEVMSEKRSGLLSMMGFQRVTVKVEAKLSAFPARPVAAGERSRDRDNRFQRGSQERGERRGADDRRQNQRDDRRGNRQEGQARRVPDERPRRESGSARRQEERRDTRPPEKFPPREKKPFQTVSQSPALSAPAQSPRPAPPARPAPDPEGVLSQWKDLLGWPDLAWELQREEAGLTVILKTSQAARLAGANGETWEAFEHLFNAVLFRGRPDAGSARVEIEGQSHPRFQRVIEEALRAAEEVKRSGRLYRLDPMKPDERRAAHQALANHPDVETISEGEGPWRKVVVRPRQRSDS